MRALRTADTAQRSSQHRHLSYNASWRSDSGSKTRSDRCCRHLVLVTDTLSHAVVAGRLLFPQKLVLRIFWSRRRKSVESTRKEAAVCTARHDMSQDMHKATGNARPSHGVRNSGDGRDKWYCESYDTIELAIRRSSPAAAARSRLLGACLHFAFPQWEADIVLHPEKDSERAHLSTAPIVCQLRGPTVQGASAIKGLVQLIPLSAAVRWRALTFASLPHRGLPASHLRLHRRCDRAAQSSSSMTALSSSHDSADTTLACRWSSSGLPV